MRTMSITLNKKYFFMKIEENRKIKLSRFIFFKHVANMEITNDRISFFYSANMNTHDRFYFFDDKMETIIFNKKEYAANDFTPEIFLEALMDILNDK